LRFSDGFALPARERGPVLRSALRRLARIFAALVMRLLARSLRRAR